MVEECKSAETGVGATIAPHSQLWNGICADFVNPAKHMSAMGKSMTLAAFPPMVPSLSTALRLSSCPEFARSKRASTKPTPPSIFIHKALDAFFIAVGVPSCAMSANEHSDVTSQKK